MYVAMCVGYFVAAAAVLKLFSSWDTKTILGRVAFMSLIANAPLLFFHGTIGVIGYVVVAIIGLRTLTSSYDLPTLFGLFSLAAGGAGSLGVMMALR
jgi:hypothetical protein